jgi:hypothetical protein
VGPKNILDAIHIATAGTKSLELNRPVMVER